MEPGDLVFYSATFYNPEVATAYPTTIIPVTLNPQQSLALTLILTLTLGFHQQEGS